MTPGDNKNLTDAARAWVALNCPGSTARAVLILLADGQRVRLPVPCCTAAPTEEGSAGSAPRQAPPPSVPLRRIHRQILGAATPRPTPAKQLATRAGYTRYNSHVKQALRDLVRLRLLLQTPDGYCLPAPQQNT